MFRFAIEKPLIIAVAVLIICLFGVLAIYRVPIQMIPDLDVRVVTVITKWPGATPQDVEKEIIIEQEEYLRRIPGLERMISRAVTGRGDIELEFSYGADINEVLIRVNNALTQVPATRKTSMNRGLSPVPSPITRFSFFSPGPCRAIQ